MTVAETEHHLLAGYYTEKGTNRDAMIFLVMEPGHFSSLVWLLPFILIFILPATPINSSLKKSPASLTLY